MDWFERFTASLAAGIFLNYILVPLIMSTALGGMIRLAFGKLKDRKQQIAFGATSFVLFLLLIFSVGTRSPRPQLSGGIQSVMAGNAGQDERNTIAVLALNVVNTGSMQTIVKNWRVSARSNGRIYDAVFPTMPDNFVFNNIPSTVPGQPEAVTFHKVDSLLEKSLTPIQTGAMLPGILFVMFQNVDPAVFKTGVDYLVTYEDVLSHQYSMEIKSSGSFGAIGLTPGVKMEATCRVPPGGLPKLGNDITSSIKPADSQAVSR
ncbi:MULTISPECIES: hypothetical protein [unclassified Bradyrhizobium]|uniref:hypothetical protein n=1 Tax=unclassified Bradyrhizobium TaxID=2631580 RepID=UPI0028F14ACD|nr:MULTISPECIES: hypothetical protein [unclassified Bradyrhizobium]